MLKKLLEELESAEKVEDYIAYLWEKNQYLWEKNQDNEKLTELVNDAFWVRLRAQKRAIACYQAITGVEEKTAYHVIMYERDLAIRQCDLIE